MLEDASGPRSASVVGGTRAAAWTAAMANGYFGHVLELDDTHDLAVLHAGASAIPAALAAAEYAGRCTGARFMEAIIAGIELTCRLGVATRLNLVEGGWIYTALFGHFGATLAAARLIDPRAGVLRNALGIVYCLASGNHQSTRERAPTKHVQPGFAAANVGNIYANEALARAGIHPLRRADTIASPRIARLATEIRAVLEEALAAGGTTLADGGFADAAGESGYFAVQLSVYGREGEPCPRCGSTVRRLVAGNRSVFFCPRCQR